MPKIKVLQIITRLDRGGSSENTLLTVLGLPRDRYALTLISGPSVNPPALLARVRAADIKLLEIKQLRRRISLWNDLIAFGKIWAAISRERFHIVHTHTSKAGLLGRLAARLNRVPIVIHTPHGHLFYGYYGKALSKFIMLIEGVMNYFADIIITLTHREKADYIKYQAAAADKLVPIYSGIQLTYLRQLTVDSGQKRKELGVEDDCFLVGCVGRLDYVKGQRYLLEAVPQVRRQIPEIKFLLVGDGPLRKDLERQVRASGLQAAVLFLGDRSNCAQIIAILDLLVLPSLNEGMGRVLLEAQALGVPVVATKVGGVAEIVRDGRSGVLIPPRRADILARVIVNLLQDGPKMAEMRSQARQWVDLKFSAQTMVEQIHRLYQKMLKEKLPDVAAG